MAYCVNLEVQSEFKSLDFTASTTAVTTTEIDRFIGEADAEINTYVGTRYTTPITGTEALKVMKMCSVWLVKSRVVNILKQKSVDPKADQDVGPSDRSRALDLLKKIAAGTVVLSDASPISSNNGGMDSYLAGREFKHDFCRDTKQW